MPPLARIAASEAPMPVIHDHAIRHLPNQPDSSEKGHSADGRTRSLSWTPDLGPLAKV